MLGRIRGIFSLTNRIRVISTSNPDTCWLSVIIRNVSVIIYLCKVLKGLFIKIRQFQKGLTKLSKSKFPIRPQSVDAESIIYSFAQNKIKTYRLLREAAKKALHLPHPPPLENSGHICLDIFFRASKKVFFP